jgi:hypothetical protein
MISPRSERSPLSDRVIWVSGPQGVIVRRVVASATAPAHTRGRSTLKDLDTNMKRQRVRTGSVKLLFSVGDRLLKPHRLGRQNGVVR